MQKQTITRRDFIKGASLAVGGSILAGCAPVVTRNVVVTATAGASPSQAAEPVVLDVWWNSDIPDLTTEWKQDPENEQYKKQWNWGGLARQMYPPFLEKHPGIKLNITGHSWDADLRQNQLMALAAQIIPDVTYGEAYVNEFAQLGVFSPVSDASAKLFPSGTTRGATKDGKVYGLPMSSGADVLFINLALWDKAGLDRTKLPKTWDELVTAAQAISKASTNDKWGNNAYYTYGPAPDTYGTAMRILHWFNQNNAPLGDDLGVPSANAPNAVDTWAFHNDLMWTSTENLILQAESEAGSGKLFNDGIIGLKPGWNNDATSVGDGKIEAVAIPFPTPPGGKPATIVIGNQINSPLKSGKNPDLAIALVEETLTNEDTQAWLANNAGIWIPALKSLLEKADTYDKLGGYKTDTAKSIVKVTMKTLLDGNPGPLPGWSRNGSRIWAEWNNAYLRIWKGKLSKDDIKKEVDALQTTIEGLVKKTG